jgi:hypothetical protein
MATKKQIQANRHNGKLGGPKTAAGKIISSKNALKHGILSNVSVLPGEDLSELKQLSNELFDDLLPQGTIQEYRVQNIINDMWYLRRIDRVEGEYLITNKLKQEFYDQLNNYRWEIMERYRTTTERRLDRNIKELHEEQARAQRREKKDTSTDASEKTDNNQRSPQPIKLKTTPPEKTSQPVSKTRKISKTTPIAKAAADQVSPVVEVIIQPPQPEIQLSQNSSGTPDSIKSSESEEPVKTGNLLALSNFLTPEELSRYRKQSPHSTPDTGTSINPEQQLIAEKPPIPPEKVVPEENRYLGIDDTFNPCA